VEKKGILILFLSNYRAQEERLYRVEGTDEIVLGAQTNDAPVRYLLRYAVEHGSCIRKIMCISSEAVREKRDHSLSDVDQFKNMVKSYIQEDAGLLKYYQDSEEKMPELKIIEYDLGNQEYSKDTSERALQVYRQIAGNLGDETEFYIDYTGGMRDISFLMTTIVRYLEYQGMSCQKIVYSNIQTMVINSIDCIYNMFRLINGVEQFVRTGNANLLADCYAKEDDDETKKLLDQIVSFSEIVSLCDVSKIDDILPKISNALNTFGKERKRYSFFVEMFDSLINIIRKKLYLSEENMTLSYPQLIRWCLDNNMIQQALTLYIEKMPKYYYEAGLLKLPEEELKIKKGTTIETAAFYTELFEQCIKSEELIELGKVLESADFGEGILSMSDIEGLKKVCKLPKTRAAINNLKRFMKQNYLDGGVGNRNQSLAFPEIYGRILKTMPKTGAGFFNQVKEQLCCSIIFCIRIRSIMNSSGSVPIRRRYLLWMKSKNQIRSRKMFL